MIRGIAAAASRADAVEAADAALQAGGSAVDAVVAGLLAVAGADEAVLLAPLVALVAGTGAGARAFDGRAAQPGRGAPRPRGFVRESDIPAGALVAAPRSVPMLSLLHAYRGRLGFNELARAGVAAAERSGAKARARLIKRVGVAGPLALRAPEVHRALLAIGGPVAGGILTPADIDEAAPADLEAATSPLGDTTRVHTAPFASGVASGDAEVIVACDGRDLLAAIAYTIDRGGLAIPDLELSIGRDASPVRRGVTRVSPGTPIASPAPIAIIVGAAGFAASVGLPGGLSLAPASLEALAAGLSFESALAEVARPDPGARAPVAVVTDGRTARSVTARS